MTAPGTHRWLTGWMLVAVVVVGLAALIVPARAVASQAGRSGTVLIRGAGFDRPQGSGRVRAVQRRLRAAGSSPGPVDGRFGPLTEAAVRGFQSARGLAVDGIVGSRTRRALRAPVPLARGAENDLPHGLRRVRALQRHLRRVGAHPGPVDGRFGPLTEAAVRRFQRAHGLAVDGIVGPDTVRRLAHATSNAAARAHDTERPPARRATEKPPAQRHPPVGANAAKKQSTPTGTIDPVEVVVLIALAAIAVALLFGVGSNWRRRSRRGVTAEDRTTPLGPPPASLPALAPTGTPEPLRSTPLREGASPARTVRALGYVSVPANSALEQAADTQARTIEEACAARGWPFVGGVREREPSSGKGLERPGLQHALVRLARGEADCLVVAELRRLTASVVELGEVLGWFDRAGKRLLVLDPGIDTGTEGGRLATTALSTVSGWERERLAERTRKGLAAARAHGAAGRPAISDRPELVKQITNMRARGMTLQAIADELNAQGIPTVRGGTRWRPSSVHAALGYKRPPTGTSRALNPTAPTAEAEGGADVGPPNEGHDGSRVDRGEWE